MVDGGVACIAHMKAPHGTTLVDVRDPKTPRQLAHVEVPAGTHSHKVRAVNGLMLVNREGHGGQRGRRARAASASATSPRRPRRARSPSGARGGARRPSLHLRRALRLHLAGDGRLRRQHRDDPRPRRSRAAPGGRPLVDAGAVDGRRRDAVVEGPAAPLPPPDPARQPALRQLLARRLRHPRHRGHGQAAASSPGSTGARPSSRRPTPRCRCRSRCRAAA